MPSSNPLLIFVQLTLPHDAGAVSALPISIDSNSNYAPPYRHTQSRSPSPTFITACQATDFSDDQDGWNSVDVDSGTFTGGLYDDEKPVVFYC